MVDRYASGEGKDGAWQHQLDAETRNTTTIDADPSPEQLMIPGLTILSHPDVERIGERVALPELLAARPVLLSRLAPVFTAPGDSVPRPLADSHLSRTPIRLIGDGGTTIVIDRGDHHGRIAVDGALLEARRVIALSELEPGLVLVFSSYVALLLHQLDPAPTALPSFDLVGESRAIVRLRRDVKRVTRLDVPVLLRGETGTGKELVARAIHQSGPRADRDCVTVNMAAVPPSLAASALFGAAKGAFTGADRSKTGFFQHAEKGTLFLDEIGETPSEVQALLLRALEYHEIQPVGAVSVRRVDVRVIAATDADLEAAVAAGDFRAPLLHRLAGYEIRVPALRHRRDDIARLLVHFLRHELDALDALHRLDLATVLPLKLMVGLVGYRWPGNVRQLRNVARRLAVLCLEGTTDLRAGVEEVLGEPLPAPSSHAEARPEDRQTTASPTPPTRHRQTYRKPSEVSEEELLAALRENAWHLKPTAEKLGVSRASLYLMVQACSRIRRAADLTRDEIEHARTEASDNIADMARRLEVSAQGLKRRMTQLAMR